MKVVKALSLLKMKASVGFSLADPSSDDKLISYISKHVTNFEYEIVDMQAMLKETFRVLRFTGNCFVRFFILCLFRNE